MSILDICAWLQRTETGQAIHESLYLFPVIEATHVLSLGLSVGTLLWMDLRLLAVGGMTRYSIARMSTALLPVGLCGFALMFLTGGILFWTQALDAYHSIYFRVKISLLLLAGLNALIYHLTLYRSMNQWEHLVVPPLGARLAGLFSIMLWTGVIVSGRAMAYNLSHLGGLP